MLRSLEKLEWPLLIEKLASFATTNDARQQLVQLEPTLSRPEIEQTWKQTSEIVDIFKNQYFLPLSQVGEVAPILSRLNRGGDVDGEDLAVLLRFCACLKAMRTFSKSFGAKSQFLSQFFRMTFDPTALHLKLQKIIDSQGQIKDDASPKLASIRQSKVFLQKRIEEMIKELFQSPDFAKYLQDDFFTIRRERYVVPIRLDGRGRIEGSILDSSDSGQTLFLEPKKIAALNEQLLDSRINEKLEIIHILRTIQKEILTQIQELEEAFDWLIEADLLASKAYLAMTLDGVACSIATEPKIDLQQMAHPLLLLSDQEEVVRNTIQMDPEKRCLIVSGPNSGGKTVVLKTIGLLHLMAKAGLLLPCDPQSSFYLFDQIYCELGDAQDLGASLSSFSGHLHSLKPIVSEVNDRDLVLLDELCSGTEPKTGAALAQAIVEHLVAKEATTCVTTHYDELKMIAVADEKTYLNGSMDYDDASLRPTFKFRQGVPGKSYGLELFANLGFDTSILERAKAIKGTSATEMDTILGQIEKNNRVYEQKIRELEKQKMDLEAQKEQWAEVKKSLEIRKAKIREELESEYKEKMRRVQEKVEQDFKALKDELKSKNPGPSEFEKISHSKKESLKQVSEEVSRVPVEAGATKIDPDQLKKGDKVRVASLGQTAEISEVMAARGEVEILVGMLKMKVKVEDLYRVEATPKKQEKGQVNKEPTPSKREHVAKLPDWVPVNQNDCLDLRGVKVSDVENLLFNYIDALILRGAPYGVVIHGHPESGGGLRAVVQELLEKQGSYVLKYRLGTEEEGGKGVTVLGF